MLDLVPRSAIEQTTSPFLPDALTRGAMRSPLLEVKGHGMGDALIPQLPGPIADHGSCSMAVLDDASFSEIVRHLDGRGAGPLFLSPMGQRARQEKVRDFWRAAVDLALVGLLWPKDEDGDPGIARVVARSLAKGEPALGALGGGNPERLRAETRREREALWARATRIMEKIQPDFDRRRTGVDVHGLRKTHRSWAKASGIEDVAIDKQLGHSNRAAEALEAFFASRIGAKHYTDLSLSMFEARRSAEAVRKILDQADADLGETLIGL